MLVLYVDDFKLSGPAESMEIAWKMIREAIITGEPHPLGHFLGCTHEAVTLQPPGSDKIVKGQVKIWKDSSESVWRLSNTWLAMASR